MLIKSLKLKDFQKHRTFKVVFSPTITSIRGATDSGKSALLRALRWICLNDWGGSDFIREGAAEARVEIEAVLSKRNALVARSKGKENTYELNGDVFRAFATNVPEEVAAVLKVTPINFQSQHDPPFWFADTAGQVSRNLNAVIDLSVIDEVLSRAGAAVRESSERKAVCQERVQELQAEWDAMSPQQVRIKEYEKLEQYRNQVQEMESRSHRLEQFRSDICAYQEVHRSATAQTVACRVLRDEVRSFLQDRKQEEQLREMIQRICELRKVPEPPDFSEIQKSYDQVKQAQGQWEVLRQLVQKIQQAQARHKSSRIQAAAALQKFHDRTQGENCPLCQNPLS